MNFIIGLLLTAAGITVLINRKRLYVVWLFNEAGREFPVWQKARLEFITQMGRGFIVFTGMFLAGVGILIIVTDTWSRYRHIR